MEGSESPRTPDWIDRINAEIIQTKPLGPRRFPIETNPRKSGTVNESHYLAATEACRRELLDNLFRVIGQAVDTSGKEFDGVYAQMRALIDFHEVRVHGRLMAVMTEAVEDLVAKKDN